MKKDKVSQESGRYAFANGSTQTFVERCTDSTISVFLFFVILILLVILVADYGALVPHNFGVTLIATPGQVVDHFGAADMASFVKGAQVINERGITAYAQGFSYFAIGIPLVESFLLSISQTLPLPGTMLGLAVAVWACAFTHLSRTLTLWLRFSQVRSIFTCAALLVFPLFHRTLLWDGTLATESISNGFFVLGVSFFLRGFMIERFYYYLGSGGCLAAASYFRAQFDLIVIAFLVTSFAISFVLVYLSGSQSDLRDSLRSSSFRKGLLVLATIYVALTMPYRYAISYPLMANTSYIWNTIWNTPERLVKMGGGFLVEGGAHSVCVINPAQCTEFMRLSDAGQPPTIQEAQRAAIGSILKHPLSFLQFKLPFAVRNWDREPILDGPLVGWSRIANNLILILLPVTFFAFFFVREQNHSNRSDFFLKSLIFSSYLVAILAGSMLFSMFIHFEPRYFIPVKMFLSFSIVISFMAIFNQMFPARREWRDDSTDRHA